ASREDGAYGGGADPAFVNAQIGHAIGKRAVAVHAACFGGRILVLGADGYGPFMYPSPGQFALVRQLPEGSRDRTFGTNGFVRWYPPWHADTLSTYAVPGVFVPRRDGRVLAAGVVYERR